MAPRRCHPQAYSSSSSVRPLLALAAMYGAGLVQHAAAWVMPPAVAAIRATGRGEGGARCTTSLSMSEGSGGHGRPNLRAMKQGFERSMDGKLIMEYVKVRTVVVLLS